MTVRYENTVTVGKIIQIERGDAVDSLEQTINPPNGEGWQLLQVLPHPSEKTVNQYFWQRQVDNATASSGSENTQELKLKPSIKLGF